MLIVILSSPVQHIPLYIIVLEDWKNCKAYKDDISKDYLVSIGCIITNYTDYLMPAQPGRVVLAGIAWRFEKTAAKQLKAESK
jgi:hypothetical protein